VWVREQAGRKEHENDGASPTHHAKTKTVMKNLSQRFSEDICKVGSGRNFDDLKSARPQIILKVMILQRHVFSPGFVMIVLSGQGDAGCVVLIDDRSRKASWRVLDMVFQRSVES
jgi:hypothetical protein